MKKTILSILLGIGTCLSAQAADISRANVNTNIIASGAAWTGGVAPGSGDVAVFGSSVGVAPATNALGADASWQGVRVTNTARNITIKNAGAETLTLGTAGIDMTQAAFNLTINPNVALGASQTWAVSNARVLTVSGVISGASGNNLTKSDAGTLVLSGDNTYSGTTTISGGTLQIGAGGLTGTLGTGDVINNGSLVFQRTNTMTVANNISGNGSVSYIPNGTKGGTFTVTGNNTYTGDTVITNATTVIVGSDSNLGNGTKLYVGQNGELHVTNSFATTKAITMSGGNPALNVDTNQTLTLNGSLGSTNPSLNGGTPDAKAGTGKLVLNAGGSFADKSTFMIQGGELDIGNAAALNGATLKINGGSIALDNTSGSAMTATGMSGVVLANGFTFTGSHDLDLSAAQAGFVANVGASRTMTVSTNKLTLSGILATGTDYTGAVRTNGGLIKAGSGTLVLKGDSDYTVNTVITNNGGKLVIDGLNLSSNITAYAGATLGGTGTVQAVTILSGGTLAAGNSPGMMTFANALLLSAGSTNIMEILSASSYDILMGSLTNSLTASGAEFVFNLTGNSIASTTTFNVLQNWSSINTNGATFSVIGLGVNQSLDYSNLGAGSVTVNVIPEPATFLLFGVGGMGAWLIRRNRMKVSEDENESDV